jgi:prepilin-type N-terminal cleavage/methylation domain-containing protein
MKRAFTLIEILIVIIIIGIMAGIGLPQYLKAVEKTRASEADVVFRNIAEYLSQYVLRYGIDACLASPAALRNAANMGTAPDETPTSCASTHYYSYDVININTGTGVVDFAANRCISGGKTPDAQVNYTLTYRCQVTEAGAVCQPGP